MSEDEELEIDFEDLEYEGEDDDWDGECNVYDYIISGLCWDEEEPDEYSINEDDDDDP